jgi:hypothetical protein
VAYRSLQFAIQRTNQNTGAARVIRQLSQGLAPPTLPDHFLSSAEFLLFVKPRDGCSLIDREN